MTCTFACCVAPERSFCHIKSPSLTTWACNLSPNPICSLLLLGRRYLVHDHDLIADVDIRHSPALLFSGHLLWFLFGRVGKCITFLPKAGESLVLAKAIVLSEVIETIPEVRSPPPHWTGPGQPLAEAPFGLRLIF